MPLPNILEFIGTNITQRKFQEAQEKLLNYLGIEVPTKTELNSEISKLNNAITPKADKIYVDTAFSNLSTTANKYYSTLAAAEADISNIALNQSVTIGEAANSGLWEKKTAGATTLTKSPYDPLTQAKADATIKANAAEANANTYTNEEIKKVVEFAPLDLASAVLDENGFAITYIGKDGTSHASDFITPEGSLSEALELTHLINQVEAKKLASVTTDGNGTILFGVNTDATIESPYPPIQGFGVDAIRSQMLSKEKLNTAGLYLDKFSSAHLNPMKWEVMVAPNATDGMGHCRMGSMYQLNPTKFYVAFTQFKTAGTDQAGGRLVARFVDVDFAAKTSVIGATRVIYDGIPNLEHPPAQPHFFKVKDGVILIFNLDHDLVTWKSTDGCLTWNEIGRYTPNPRTFWLALDGVVQIQNGIYKDRLVAAGFTWAGSSEASMFLRSMYSDDFGVTWQVGYDFDPVTIGLSKSMNETGITVDTNNDLIFIVRNESGVGDRDTTTGKTFFKSTDGGKTVTRFYPDAPFIAAICQTGILQFAQNPWEGVPKIITTAPLNVGSRNGLKMRISYDNMKSTAWEYNIYPTSLVTGYSSIKRVSPDMLGIVCEYGGFNAVSNVVINFINFKEVFNGSTI